MSSQYIDGKQIDSDNFEFFGRNVRTKTIIKYGESFPSLLVLGFYHDGAYIPVSTADRLDVGARIRSQLYERLGNNKFPKDKKRIIEDLLGNTFYFVHDGIDRTKIGKPKSVTYSNEKPKLPWTK